MAFSSKSTHIDRDDFATDHYADFVRDTHRTRLTFDLLDIAKRQHRRKEKLLCQAHCIKMKEHIRIENGFLRKLEQNTRISNLPIVRETLRAQRRQGLNPSPPPSSSKHSQETIQSVRQRETSSQKGNQSRPTTRPPSARTERLNANFDKFNQTNSALC